MAYAKIENPETDIRKFNLGDFVHWLMYDRIPSIGIVMEKDATHLYIAHYEDGFPFALGGEDPIYFSCKKATKDEVLEHFEQIHDKFEEEFKHGGLNGAVSSRRQHYLDQVSRIIKDEESRMLPLVLKYGDKVREPMTGIYVLDGIYSGQGPGRILQGITVEPRVSERTLGFLMKDICPQGFGAIPKEVRNTAATSHGDLVGYDAYEIPEKAMRLVVDPKQINILEI